MALSEEKHAALSRSAGDSLGKLDVFRKNKNAALRQKVGTHYSDNGAEYKVPVNLIELAENIYLQRLVASTPAVAITTKYPRLREVANRFKLAANHLIQDEINLERTMERGVAAAILSVGITKVGLNHTQVEYMGVLHDSGQPFALNVNLDNWVHDMTVDSWEQCQYMGDRYSMSVEDAKKMFPKESHEYLNPATPDMLDSESANSITSGGTTKEEYNETLLLWDVWLTKENTIVTFVDSGDPSDPFGHELHSRPWFGVETGPYHILGFNEVDGNTMPLAPVAAWMDLHELANMLFRKLGRQAQRQKTNQAVPGGSRKDGNALKNANDGDLFPCDNPDKIKEVKSGGIDPSNLAFFLETKELQSLVAGNLDTLGGLSPQADTLGQENLLSAGASQRMQKMQKRVYSWAKSICQALCFYLFNDPYINIPIVKRLPGFDDIEVQSNFGPQDRNESDFLQYNIQIEPHSMQHLTPEQKLQSLMLVLDRLIPLAPVMAQQGIGINYQKYVDTISDLANLPELKGILVSQEAAEEQPVGQPPAKAANTTRTNIRVNRPGATGPGKEQAIKAHLLGANPQSKEMAAVHRPTG